MNDCYITRNTSSAARALGGCMVVMSADSSLFTLNEVATAIWNAADGQKRLSEIVERIICEEFDIDRQTAWTDAEDFVARLSKHGVITVSDQPIGGTKE